MNLIELSLVCFGGGGSYAPPPPPDVPTEDSPEAKRAKKDAADKERAMARKRKGRRSTILTSGLGVAGDPITQYGKLTGKSKLGQ